MNKDLQAFLELKAKQDGCGSYTFALKEINFSVTETPLGLNLMYYYIKKRQSMAPQSLTLDINTSVHEFSKKIVEIVEKINS